MFTALSIGLAARRKNSLYKKHALSKAELDIATAHLKADEVKIVRLAVVGHDLPCAVDAMGEHDRVILV